MTAGLSREEMAREVALDLPEGAVVNLGIGHPTQVARFVPAGREVVFHSENGVFGVGPEAEPGAEDWDLVDAGKHPVTVVPGASFVSHADSFAAIRGGHIDITVMGAFEVSVGGDLANWTPGPGPPGRGRRHGLGGRGQAGLGLVRPHHERRPAQAGPGVLPPADRQGGCPAGLHQPGLLRDPGRPVRGPGPGRRSGRVLRGGATGAPVVLGDGCARLPRA